VVIALVLTTGLHWATLQTVAWAAMLANNLRYESLTEAVSQTFDGEHPCCMCKAIAAAKKSGQKTELALSVQKFEYPPATETLVLVAPTRFHLLPQASFSAEVLTHEPPVPPPRRFFV
jgi:hypothetical protein